MKAQMLLISGEIITESELVEHKVPPENQIIDVASVIYKHESDDDRHSLNTSTDSLNTTSQDEIQHEAERANSENLSSRLKIPPKPAALTDEELINIYSTLVKKANTVPVEQFQKWAKEYLKEKFEYDIPKSLEDMYVGFALDGDTGNNMDVRPKWLDIEKFRRGQKFAYDNLFGVFYAELLSLFLLYSFNYSFASIVCTGNSSTPYSCFKRYFSTALRICNWYTHDVWTPGNPGYEDMRAVRRIHSLVRKKNQSMPADEYTMKSKIENPWCPHFDSIRRDFQSAISAQLPVQSLYNVLEKLPSSKYKYLNQGEMICTQFGFVGLVVLSPKTFGLHDATDDDLEAFCHLWRGLGYLQGIDDNFNLCRGTLEDVRTRSRDLLEFKVKPNLRNITPEWEHVMRCITESLKYYFPYSTYESCLCDFSAILNLHIPRLYNTMSYTSWFKYISLRFMYDYACKISRVRTFLNNHLIQSIERAKQFDEKKHKELQERSEETLNSVHEMSDKCTMPIK